MRFFQFAAQRQAQAFWDQCDVVLQEEAEIGVSVGFRRKVDVGGVAGPAPDVPHVDAPHDVVPQAGGQAVLEIEVECLLRLAELGRRKLGLVEVGLQRHLGLVCQAVLPAREQVHSLGRIVGGERRAIRRRQHRVGMYRLANLERVNVALHGQAITAIQFFVEAES